MKKIMTFANAPIITVGASVVGKKEHEGPLGSTFDIHDDTCEFGMSTWEGSETEMQRMALQTALAKAKLTADDIDCVFAGDLMNQCTGASYGMKSFASRYFGLYGACSTFAEGLILSSMAVSCGFSALSAVVTSSHFCSAERQFRFPIEYGCQRTPTSQWTVTGSGAVIIGSNGNGPRIVDALPGRITDKGLTDVNNMGAAMAPAAIDTLNLYFTESNTSPRDYDLILTGDLGREGHSVLREFMRSDGYDIENNSNDCGMMIFSASAQDVHSGGSGCGCCATVFSSYILPRLVKKELNNILLIATGALMSPDRLKQGDSIPGIAHLVHIVS